MIMKLSVYNEVEHRHFLDFYGLTNRSHNDTPQKIMALSLKDKDRYLIVIFDDVKMFGCFVFTLTRGIVSMAILKRIMRLSKET